MDFSQALVYMKLGSKVGRQGWNGKGMFIYPVPANNYVATTEAARSYFGTMAPYGRYIAMKTHRKTLYLGWLHRPIF
jgi:hypothetical protein